MSLVQRFSYVLLALGLLALCLNAALPVSVRAATTAWTPLGEMSVSRDSHTATLLLNGKVLVAGGKNSVAIKTASLYDPIANTWNDTGEMASARYAHTATILQNGRVLVVGGKDDAGFLTKTELYDPIVNAWTPGEALGIARSDHTATLLPNGKVLVIGGQNTASGALGTVVLYTPTLSGPGAWATKTSLTTPRYAHTATLLSDGRVLVVGGKNTDGSSLSDVEIYDPVADSWADGADLPAISPALTTPRANHAAILLPGNKVLVAGGEGEGAYLNSSVLYDVLSDTWAVTSGTMIATRSGHTATLTPNGNVLVVGGRNAAILSSAELYDPLLDSWTDDGLSMSTGRQLHTTTLLPFGDVLVVGGSDGANTLKSVDLYRLVEVGKWTPTGSLAKPRYSQKATPLIDGRVLVTGGQDLISILKTAEIYTPSTNDWTEINSMNYERNNHTATLLPNGKVLVAGGQTTGQGQYLASAELYDPQTGLWSMTGSMSVARARHTATLLPDGLVLVVGGRNADEIFDISETYDPATGVWQFAGNIAPPRYNHTAVMLPDESVLIMGGIDRTGVYIKGTQVYVPSSSGYSWFSASGEVKTPRNEHSSILLPNGKVLMVGGIDDTGTVLGSCELYNPAAVEENDKWTIIPNPLTLARQSFNLVLLPNGKVLAVGGFSADALNNLELHDLVTATGKLALENSMQAALGDSELYDPLSGTWTPVASLNANRGYTSATLLPDGQVLVSAGLSEGGPTTGAELYNMFSDSFDPAWRPTLTDLLPLKISKSLTLSGTQFRGYQLGEGAGGTTASSATNYPLVQLRRIDNNQVRWLTLDDQAGFSDTTFKSTRLSTMLSGPAPFLVAVYVNGIPSEFKSLKVELFKTFVPLIQRILPIKKYFVPVIKR
jgi:N-acetylneuraminic acid mutarotase